MEPIRGNLWHRYSIKLWWWPLNLRSHDFLLTTMKSWFSALLVLSNHLTDLSQWHPDMNHKFWNFISTGIYTQYAGVVVILLHINRKFTMEILQSSLLSHSFALNRRSTSISRCKIRHEADLAVSVASFKSSSTG
jgi:hypothetical protein